MTYLGVYLAGVVLALAVMRDPWPARVATALVWPLGPAAFLVVLAILTVVSFVVWPLPMVSIALLLGALVWWLT